MSWMCFEKLRFLSIRTPRYFVKCDPFIEKLRILSSGVSMKFSWETKLVDVFEGLMEILY